MPWISDCTCLAVVWCYVDPLICTFLFLENSLTFLCPRCLFKSIGGAYIGYQVIKELWCLVIIGRKESFAVEDIHGASTECLSPGNSLKGLLTKAPRSSEHRAPWSHSPRLRCSGLPQIFGRLTRNKNIKTRRTNVATNNSRANEGLVTNYVSSYYFHALNACRKSSGARALRHRDRISLSTPALQNVSSSKWIR
jgi:hypothetical protein